MQSSAQNRRRACSDILSIPCDSAVAHGCRSEGKPHPRTYTPEDVTAATVKRLRGTIREAEPCYPSAALR